MIHIHENMGGPGIRRRDVQVWVPPGYGSFPQRRYPVLYMHDGQNVFDPATSTHGIAWEADLKAEELINEGKMKETIIAAVNHTPDRMDEYDDSPRGRDYMNFMARILKPYIDGIYRTMPGPEATAVAGSSMGGLISLLLAWNYPGVFGMAGCLSPVFVAAGVNILPVIREKPKPPVKIYIDNGGRNLDAQLQRGCDLVVAELLKKGFRRGIDMEWFFDPDDDHSEEAWRRRLWRPLLFFFGDK